MEKSHDCTIFMKSKLQVKDKELVAARAEIERLTKRLQELELSNLSNSNQLSVADQLGPKCLNGHPMKYTNQAIVRKNRAGLSIGSGQQLFCNKCGANQSALQGYYHCGSKFCDYDFCLSCGTSD